MQKNKMNFYDRMKKEMGDSFHPSMLSNLKKDEVKKISKNIYKYSYLLIVVKISKIYFYIKFHKI